ncbi:MAG TPA: glycerophosphodiester phosphodiesterase [Pyrinomonadaceae bacterium]|nr:glycerophosphodiester phosphodiesterase [Pyrinomonadaceae bacterium]
MARKLIKWSAFFLLAVVVVMDIIYGSLAKSAGEPATESAFFLQSGARPLAIAHRGGAGLFPENTLYAFERAADLGVDVIEIDVRSTSDGTLVVIHDATVERTTDGSGRVVEMTLDRLKRLDAGYRFSPDGGKTFPLRQSGVTIPTLREVFTAFPAMRFNIEPKQSAPSIIKPLCSIIREHKMIDKSVVGSFTQAVIDDFRRECPEVATSASTTEVAKFLGLYKAGLSKSFSPAMKALQIPEFAGVGKEFVAAARARNLQVHLWTINETADMKRLLDMGVDGIMTDYPDRLLELLGRTKPRQSSKRRE